MQILTRNMTTGAMTPITDDYVELVITDGSGQGVADTITFTLPDYAEALQTMGDQLVVLQPAVSAIQRVEGFIYHGPYDIQGADITGPEHLVSIKGRKNLHWESLIANQELDAEKSIIARLTAIWLEGSAFTSVEPYRTWLAYVSQNILNDEGDPVSASTYIAGMIYSTLNQTLDFSGIVSVMERWGLTIFSEVDETGEAFIQVESRYPLAEGQFAGRLTLLDDGNYSRINIPQVPGIALEEYTEEPSYNIGQFVNRPGRYRTRRIVGERRLFGAGEDISAFVQGTDLPELPLEEAVEYLAEIFVEMKRWDLQNNSMTAKFEVPIGSDVADLDAYVYPRQIINAPNPAYPDLDEWRVVGVTRKWEQHEEEENEDGDAIVTGHYSESYDLALHQGYFYRVPNESN